MAWSFILIICIFFGITFLVSYIDKKCYEKYLQECAEENKKPMSYEQWWNEQHWNE